VESDATLSGGERTAFLWLFGRGHNASEQSTCCIFRVIVRPCLVGVEKTVALSFVCGNYCLTMD